MLQPEVVHAHSPRSSPTLSPALVPEVIHDQANALPPLEPSLASNHTNNAIPTDAEASQPLEHCAENPGSPAEGSPVQGPAEVAAAPAEDDAAAALQSEQAVVLEAATGPECPEAEVSSERHLHQELVLHCVGKVRTACVLVLSAHLCETSGETTDSGAPSAHRFGSPFCAVKIGVQTFVVSPSPVDPGVRSLVLNRVTGDIELKQVSVGNKPAVGNLLASCCGCAYLQPLCG